MIRGQERYVADGVVMLGRFRPCHCASYVLFNGGEAAVMEMPPASARKRPPWAAARRFLRRNRLRLQLLTASHGHWDHLGGFPAYRATFPAVPFVAHSSWGRQYRFDGTDYVYGHLFAEFSLAGEPLFVVHGPKHSPLDQLVVFRGTVCTGDWTLGSMGDCNASVSVGRKIETLRLLQHFLAERRYRIHTAYSAHGNDIRRGIDFTALLARMERYWHRRR